MQDAKLMIIMIIQKVILSETAYRHIVAQIR